MSAGFIAVGVSVLAAGAGDLMVPKKGLRNLGGTLLPGRWYAGDHGKKPVVRSQGSYGTCWAMTAVSALESSLLPGEHLVFSADHLSLNNHFSMGEDPGGDFYMIMAYLSGWQGPVPEEEDPYGDGYSPEGLSPAVHVQEMLLMENASVDAIKEAVYQYGAVQTSLFMSRQTTSSREPYYNELTASYYYPLEMTTDHDVLILGWDDDFSRFHFGMIPETDGAFICQNTWGSGFGNDGIFYVSYADANIGGRNLIYSKVETVDNYDHIYQTDECGWQGSQGYDNETCWFANVYEIAGEEELAAVGFYSTAPDASYEVYLVRDFQDAESFSKREYLQRGTLQKAGYHTIELQNRQRLKEGERLAVIISITVPGEKMPVAVEIKANEYTSGVTTAGKEGYLSRTGELWENTEEKFGTNVCLKAYTVDQ